MAAAAISGPDKTATTGPEWLPLQGRLHMAPRAEVHSQGRGWGHFEPPRTVVGARLAVSPEPAHTAVAKPEGAEP